MNSSTLSTPTCFQCGSSLILVSKETTQPEGALFPQTASIYRCSNQACQDQKDQDEKKRIAHRDTMAEADKKRAEEKQRRREEKVLKIIGEEESKKTDNF